MMPISDACPLTPSTPPTASARPRPRIVIDLRWPLPNAARLTGLSRQTLFMRRHVDLLRVSSMGCPVIG